MKRNRKITFALCLIMLFCTLAVTALAADCSHVPAEAVQESIVEATYTKGGSYELVVYCDECDEELSRTKVKTDKQKLPKVEDVTAEAVATDVIKVSWGFVEDADGYRLYMFNHETNKFETVETIRSAYTTGAAATNVYAAKENIFMVRAYVKEDGKTVWSPESESVTVHVRPTVPKNLKFTSTANEITFKWDKVEGADGYRIYEYDAVKNKYNELATVQTNKHTVKIASQGTGVFVKVKAYKKAGGKTLWSEATGRFYAKTKPLPVTDIKYKVSASGIELIWGELWFADGYRIYQYNSKTKKWVSIKTMNRSVYTGTCSYTVEGVSGGTYKFRIKSFNKASGKTVWGKASKTITVKAAPAEVKKIVAASQTTTSLKLSWEKAEGAKGYRIYIYDSAIKDWKKVKTTSDLSCNVKNLKPGTTYGFKIAAYRKVNGETVWGNTSASIATVTKPAAVTGAKASAGSSDTVELSWQAVTGATGYTVYQYNSAAKKWDAVKTTAGTGYTVGNLKSATEYKFIIRAYIKFESKIYWSDASSVITAATKPEKVQVTAKSEAPGQVSVSWKAVPGAKLYRFYYKVNGGKYKLYKVYTEPQNLTFKNLKGGDKYTFAVRAGFTVGSETILSDVLETNVTVTYRITRYLKVVKSGTYYTRYKDNGVVFEEAMKGDKLYTTGYDENGNQIRLVYIGAEKKWYYIYDQAKIYAVVSDSELPTEARGSEVIKAVKAQKILTPYKSTTQDSMFSEWVKHGEDGIAYINYCFSGTTLKKAYLDMESGLVIERDYEIFTNNVPDSLFAIPSDYQCVN